MKAMFRKLTGQGDSVDLPASEPTRQSRPSRRGPMSGATTQGPLAALPKRGRSVSMSRAAQAMPHPSAQPQWPSNQMAGGSRPYSRPRAASMSRADARAVPIAAEVPWPRNSPFGFQPEIPRVRTHRDGSATFGPSASLSDAMPLLTQAVGRTSVLVATFEPNGSVNLAWQIVRHDRQSIENSRAALRNLVLQIPAQDAILRPFIELQRNSAGKESYEVLRSTQDAIDRCIADINGARRMNAGEIEKILRPLAERMHRVAMLAVPGTRAARDALRPPVEFVVDWMVALRGRLNSLPPNQVYARDAVQQLEGAIRKGWIQHHFEPSSLSNFFHETAQWCRTSAVPELRSLANQISFEIAEFARHFARFPESQAPLAVLYDNDMMRSWETSFASTLVKYPPRAALNASGTMLAHLAARMRHLLSNNADRFDATASMLQRLMQGDRRFWMKDVPEIERFVDARGRDERRATLLDYLDHHPRSGQACVGVHYSTVKLSRALGKHAPAYKMWDNTPQDDQEFKLREAARSIVKTSGYFGLGSGVHLAHQPGLDSGPYMHAFGSRPTLKNRPNLDAPSHTVTRQLHAAAPYGSGPSGSAGFISKFVDFIIRQEGAKIDRPSAVLGAFMFVCFDGGHSLSEVMWEMNLLKSRPRETRIDMGIVGEPVHPDRFVGRYQNFMDSFPMETRYRLENASNQAFEDMLRYDRQRSNHLAH